MITTNVEVNSTEFNDYQRMSVSRSVDQYNSSSNFSVTYDSSFGKHSDDFSVGNNIKVFADDSDGTDNLLTGIIEKVSYKGTGTSQKVTLTGRDFSLRLQDSTVEPSVFTDSEISTIVTNIISSNVDDITVNNVDVTSTTLKRIEFNHESVFDALKKLSELAGYFFFIDNDKDLHFEKRNNVDSGITLDNTNINGATLNQTREGMANDIHVYGNRYLAGFQETFNVSGSIGSVTNLINKPRNTFVTLDGTPQTGGVFELTVSPTSGANYLVSYNDSQLVWQSGTEIGYSSIPVSGQQIVASYDREVPIVKTGIDRASVSLYGRKEKIINDKSINDPNTATDILKKELEKSSPFKGFESDIFGWFDITPGNTARVTLSDFNIDEEVGILNVSYKFNKNTVQSEQVIRIRLDKKILDITDEITDIRSRLNAIEAADRSSSDQLTRLELSQNDFSVVGSSWEIRTNVTTGSGFHLYSTGFVPPVNPWHLASGTDQGALAGSFTGSASIFVQSTIVSGGFYN